MTTIAYRDRLLAGDTMVTCGGIRSGTYHKVGRTPDGHLFAGVGDSTLAERFVIWMQSRVGDPPSFEAKGDVLIHVTPDGCVREWWGSGWCQTEAPFYSWGSGGEIALGAMAMGATAFEAVGVAAKFDTRTGGETMDVVSLG